MNPLTMEDNEIVTMRTLQGKDVHGKHIEYISTTHRLRENDFVVEYLEPINVDASTGKTIDVYV